MASSSRYSQDQVSAMIINPMVDGDIISLYPNLQSVVPKSIGFVDLNKQFRYLSWMYDFRSPAVRDFSDIKRRKEWAKKEVGLMVEPNYELAISFLTKVVNNRVWVLICSLESTFVEYAERVGKKIEDDDTGKEIDILKAVEIKNKLLTQMGDMIEKIDALYIRLFAGDEDLKDEHDTRMAFTPESIAKKLK